MLLFNILDYEDFKFLFGYETHGNGAKSRKNKILLQHLKNPALIKWCRERGDFSLLRIRSMAELKKLAMSAIQESGKNDERLDNKVELMGKTFWSSLYRTDSMKGLCEDFDKKAVRYVNAKTGRVYKMKAGKLITALIKETELGQILSEQTVNWLSEEFSADWQTYAAGQTPDVALHVDSNFAKIYSDRWCRSFNGCSCMSGRGHHEFYENSVEAKAAYITDKEGFVLARAVIFENATDQNGKKWRLLERQYSKESSEVLKRLLVDLLIKGGHIDGYKQVGAGCSEARAFVANDGSSLSGMKFSIKCELDYCSTISYQDSFKWYDMNENLAYNYSEAPHDYTLDTTDLNLDGDCDDPDEEELDYDDYHDYSCDQTRICFYHGREVYVDVDNLEDFVFVDGEYYHLDDVAQCGQCGKWVVRETASYNSDAEEFFCREDCQQEYIRENFCYSEFDDDYYYNEDDLATINAWDEEEQAYREMTISKLSLQQLINSSKAFGANQTWFVMGNAA